MTVLSHCDVNEILKRFVLYVAMIFSEISASEERKFVKRSRKEKPS